MRTVLVCLAALMTGPPAENTSEGQADGARPAARVIDRSYTPQAGDHAYLDTGEKDGDGDPFAVAAAVSVNEFVNYVRLEYANNDAAVDKMEAAKTLLLLDAGTEVLVTGLRPVEIQRVQGPQGVAAQFLVCAEIKVGGGEAKGKVLYVDAEEVVRYQAAPAPAAPSATRRKAGKTKRANTTKNAPAATPKGTASKPVGDPGARAASLLKLGQSLEKSGKTAGALDFYRKVVKEFPESTAAKVAGERLQALGRP